MWKTVLREKNIGASTLRPRTIHKILAQRYVCKRPRHSRHTIGSLHTIFFAVLYVNCIHDITTLLKWPHREFLIRHVMQSGNTWATVSMNQCLTFHYDLPAVLVVLSSLAAWSSRTKNPNHVQSICPCFRTRFHDHQSAIATVHFAQNCKTYGYTNRSSNFLLSRVSKIMSVRSIFLNYISRYGAVRLIRSIKHHMAQPWILGLSR